MNDWHTMLAETIAAEKDALEATLGRTLTTTETALAEHRGRIKAPDDPESLAGRWAHGVSLERLGVVAERWPTAVVVSLVGTT